MPRSHVYQAPFMEAGHAINMLNVGSVLATAELQVHVLALSKKNTEQWLKATGQASNPNLSITVVADGKWEEWKWSQPSEVVHMLFDPEFNAAMDNAISIIKAQYPEDNHTALFINTLMSGLVEVSKKHSLKLMLLVPVAYYMYRIDGAVQPDSKMSDMVNFRGIGGLNKEMPTMLGDVMEWFGPMRAMGQAATEEAYGSVFSNTNEGLEGEEHYQPHLPNRNASREQRQKNYMIGPILPSWYERATAGDLETAATRDKSHSAIQFLDRQAAKSVVYITMGSVAQLTVPQAVKVITLLRSYKLSWIILFRKNQTTLESAIGDHTDGIIADWVPQLDIMLHPSIKLVFSHGGFGTMIEGVFAGQPFICSPIFSDQFIDTRVMEHLGICVGNLAVNKFETIMQKKEVVPYWHDDGGRVVEEVLERAFGEGGEEMLEKARLTSLALRERMVKTKIGKGGEALRLLRDDLKSGL